MVNTWKLVGGETPVVFPDYKSAVAEIERRGLSGRARVQAVRTTGGPRRFVIEAKGGAA